MSTEKSSDAETNQVDLSLKQTELKIKKWDLIFKIGGLLALIFGIIFPLIQYTNTLERDSKEKAEREIREQRQRDKEIDAALREARKPFLEKQQILYFDAADVTSKLATLPQGTEREEAKRKFYQLYWGGLSVVEDSEVEAAMVQFKTALEEYERKEISSEQLQKKSLALAHSFRNSLARGWDYDRGGVK